MTELAFSNWQRRLHALRRRLRWHQAAEGAAAVLGGTVAAAVVLAWLDWRLELSAPTRSAIVVFGGVAVAWQVVKRLAVPLLRRMSLLDVASLADRGLARRDPHAPPGFAATAFPATTATATLLGDDGGPLNEAARRAAARRLADVPLETALRAKRLRRNLAVVAIAAAVPITLAVSGHWIGRVLVDRWVLIKDTPWPRATTIQIEGLRDGVLQVPRGEAASIAVRLSSVHPRPVAAGEPPADLEEVARLAIEPANGPEQTFVLDQMSQTASRAGDVTTGPLGGRRQPVRYDSHFRGELPPLAAEATASVWGGDARPLTVAVRPVDRPQVVGLSLTARHPAEPKPQTLDLAGGADVRLLKDSDVSLSVTSSVPVDTLGVEGADVRVVQTAADRFEVAWTHTAAAAMRLTLRSDETGLESFPRSVAVGLLPDRPPAVSLRHSGVRLRVTPVAEIPLSASARDDFGVASLLLRGESTRLTVEAIGSDEPAGDPPKSPGEIPLFTAAGDPPPDRPRRVDRDHRLLLEELALKPGDVVKLSAEARDAAYGGAQTRTSRSVVFQVVKQEDLFREVLLRLQQLRARLRKAADDADVLATALRTAELPSDASALSRRLQVTRREVAAVTTQIAQTVDEMRLNRLGGPETTDIIARTVVGPLQRLQSGAMDRQRRAVAELASEPSGRDDAARRQDEIVASLREALKNMAQWDSFVDVVNQLNAVISLEETVRQRTDSLMGGQPPADGDPPKGDRDDAASDIFD